MDEAWTPGQVALARLLPQRDLGQTVNSFQAAQDARFGVGHDKELAAVMGPGLLAKVKAMGGTDPAFRDMGAPAMAPAAPAPAPTLQPMQESPMVASTPPLAPSMTAAPAPFGMAPPARPATLAAAPTPEPLAEESAPLSLTVRGGGAAARDDDPSPYAPSRAADAPFANGHLNRPAGAGAFGPDALDDGFGGDMGGDLFANSTEAPDAWSQEPGGTGDGDFNVAGFVGGLGSMAGLFGGKQSGGGGSRAGSVAQPVGPIPFDSKGFAGLLSRRAL